MKYYNGFVLEHPPPAITPTWKHGEPGGNDDGKGKHVGLLEKGGEGGGENGGDAKSREVKEEEGGDDIRGESSAHTHLAPT